jgi:MYXO-CTERM domain-containing protein
MKNSTKFVLSMGALALMAAEAATAGFTGYIIRNADSGAAPVINASTSNSINATIDQARQKVGFGSNDVNGRTIGEISLMNITRTDNGTAFKPYVNIWVTNGAGNYAVISISPWGAPGAGVLSTSYTTMNALGSASDNRGPGQDVYVYETTNTEPPLTPLFDASGAQINSNKGTSWLSTYGDGVYLTISDVANLVIAPPPTSWFPGNGTGSGAPRELGTNVAFGFNWIMGSVNATGGQYSQPTPYDLTGISVVPAPGALALLGVAGLVGGRRRRA